MKKINIILCGLLCICGTMQAQERLTVLYGSDTVSCRRAPSVKVRKNVQGVFYQSVQLPFEEDFSDYTGYPDTALWIDNYAYVSTGFAYNPPTLGTALLDAVDYYGRLYAHASTSSFTADSLTSRPIRLDSVFTPLKRAMELSDSLYFSFYFQPGGGKGKAWERLGDAPEVKDSLILEFGYQTGDTALLYYITDLQSIADTVIVGDTIVSMCNSNIYIIADRNYYPGDVIEVPCDSVLCMEVIWERVWASPGMSLEEFETLYGACCKQVMIPINDAKYLNAGFQFRFRNIASLEYESDEAWAGNVDFWTIDYVRLNRMRSMADTAIDDVAFVENPGSLLKEYTSMPWSHFNGSSHLKASFANKLTNLYNVTKNTTYEQQVLDEDHNLIGSYSGGSYNIDPFFSNGYQTYAPHATPQMANITFPSAVNDSLSITMYHIFKEAGSGDQNPKNDTAAYRQNFYNYFSYDDGTPESGYLVTSSVYPYTTCLAMDFTLSHADTLRAVRMYVNRPLNEESPNEFNVVLWEDDNGKPGREIYKELIEQEFSRDIYGMQHFELQQPQVVQGKIYVGYQTLSSRFLNIGFDQNTDASSHVFYRTASGWQNSFIKGTPMIRPVVGKKYEYNQIDEYQNIAVDLYPNPVSNMLYINSGDRIDGVEIYSLSGQLLKAQSNGNPIDVGNLPQGMYMVRVKGDTFTVTKKVMVSR
ncbi:MAG: T9SS type A sorting domain-containing protein [Bacteroidales bacterium]|nr:T9SS type A sorting domain-containing protein [Bacteroidales bacterium]